MEPDIDTEAQLIAVDCMVLALVNAHPDRKRLRSEFAAITSHIQVGAVADGFSQNGRKTIREAIQKYFDHLDDLDQAPGIEASSG